ncbi:Clan AA, family A2, retrotansposon aspartic peptidase [Tritrichomonas foetus]|uniref:Clan AA, family A2, retrotansposon aspartic peptidase n=1 Tax=Tritrichomonas foetus TaxID=1144522 RepID=A0A1J4JZW5_9EUKA|nr:Clan AA, family A2, retrotansposon aspartic peptidase [Tritrichomonas foetus]|eukprot:OHT04711.1 Clan AA, family A2, retrotansposon aspartic peptidase [Tritrichomonas foetus]
MLIFVKLNHEEDPFEVEIEEDSTIGYLIAIVASMRNINPENLTITLEDRILSPDTLITSLDLGSILYFTAVVAQDNDRYMSSMFDVRQQQMIMQQIQQQNIEDNLQYAYEHNPEAFIPFSLLYITCKINNVPIKALIDTGAQISILPLAVAQRCHVDYLIDKRYRTVTMGVGAQTSHGRIHALPVQVGDTAWTNPFVVLDNNLDHCILGVDWLTKNRATISLETMTLNISGTCVKFEELTHE